MKVREITDMNASPYFHGEEDEELLNSHLHPEDPNYAKYRKYLENLRQRDYSTYLDIISYY